MLCVLFLAVSDICCACFSFGKPHGHSIPHCAHSFTSCLLGNKYFVSLSHEILQLKCNEHSLVATGSNTLLAKRLFNFSSPRGMRQNWKKSPHLDGRVGVPTRTLQVYFQKRLTSLLQILVHPTTVANLLLLKSLLQKSGTSPTLSWT